MIIVFWYWWAIAAVLLVLEMLLPGLVFMFLAIGAAASGLLLLVASGAALELQLFVFAIVAVVSAVLLRPMLRRLQDRSHEPTINARAASMVGRTFFLDQPLLGGRGRAVLGDGSWTITGPDMAAGAKVRVAAVDGTELRVEPAP
jgi:membrane protein implicated in regulation of membrane protease activity